MPRKQFSIISFFQRRFNAQLAPTLRNYQQECIQSCLDEFKLGIRKQIVSLPVGMIFFFLFFSLWLTCLNKTKR